MNPIVPFTLQDWLRSVINLGYEIQFSYAKHNLLGDEATERGRYFLSDSHIPKPRVSTALAWASLCAIGPVNGFIRASADGIHQTHFQLDSGNFVLPFLPKLLHSEESDQSLTRTSKAHIKNRDGKIRWGHIYIADAATGDVIEELTHGQRNPKEWVVRPHPGDSMNMTAGQLAIPPLYAAIGEGWQFGVIQMLPGISVTLRDPFLELAKRGFGVLSTISNSRPNIRSMLFRFINVPAAQSWASAYSAAMRAYPSTELRVKDQEDIWRSMQESIKNSKKDDKKTSSSSKGRLDDSLLNMIAQFRDNLKA